MKVVSLIATVLENIIKVVILALAIMFVLKWTTKAYDFGYKVFADEPISAGEGRTITVGVAESADVKDVAEMLQEKGLIEDANLFVIQEYLSAHHGEIKPGIYDLSTGMTANEMISIMSTESENISVPTGDSEPVSNVSEESGEEISLEDALLEEGALEDAYTEEVEPVD